MTGTLVLLRHGESTWNREGLFTGWVDVGLSEKGEAEARRGGDLLVQSGILPAVVHTSLQRRAIRTVEIALDTAVWVRITVTDALHGWVPARSVIGI